MTFKRVDIFLFFLSGLFFSIPLFSVTVFPNVVLYLFTFCILFFYLKKTQYNRKIDKQLILFLTLYICPSIIGLIALFPALIMNQHDLDYGSLSFVGRILNLILFTFCVLIINSYMKTKKSVTLYKWLWFGGVIFVFFCLWHASAIYTTFIKFPFETRSYLHSASTDNFFINERVTGIANEPSYVGPFVIDFIILTFLFIKSLMLRLFFASASVIVLILTLSPSSIVVFFGALLFGASVVLAKAFMFSGSFHRAATFFSIVVVFMYTVTNYFANNFIGDYILVRLQNIELSDRYFMNVFPFILSMDASFTQLVFGNGLKTYSIIGTQFDLPSGYPVHETSNSYFVDSFWEAGLLGLSVSVVFYIVCLVKVLVRKMSAYQTFYISFLLGSLFLTSFIRADYASLRTFVMLHLLYLLLDNKLNDNYGIRWK